MERGSWECGKVQVGRGEDGKMIRGRCRWEGGKKVGRCKPASSASGDALSHLDTQEVISRMVPVVGLVVTIHK